MILIKNFKCKQLVNLLHLQKNFAKLSEKTASASKLPTSSFHTSSVTAFSKIPTPIPTEKTDRDSAGVLNLEVYGQPTASTHPHLINDGEMVVGVTVEEFKQRRLRLMTGLQKFARDNDHNSEQLTNHILVVPSATKKYMSGKIPYVFRQNSDFYYLCGCLEPDSVLMCYIDERSEVVSTMFMRPKDKNAELWDGPRTGVDCAIDLFGVDETHSVDQFHNLLVKRIGDKKVQFWYDTAQSDLSKITSSITRVTDAAKTALNSPANFIQSMRLFKSPAEQQLMRRTCEIASTSFNEVMTEARPGLSEHHLNAMIDYKCRMRNASYLAYPPVVAAGMNTTTIHYINNTQLTRSGDLVLMDAGCEYGGYTSDITRTWPISGEFTEPQKVLYDVILSVQKEMISFLLKKGGETLDQLFDTMCYKLGKYLQEVGLVAKHFNDDQELTQAGFKFCPHHISHYLGMDVHDTPLMPRSLRLLPGMVFTVEPGIYIAHDRMDVPKEFRGLGVRIEDDLLINADNQIEILTGSCIKERHAIESLFKVKP